MLFGVEIHNMICLPILGYVRWFVCSLKNERESHKVSDHFHGGLCTLTFLESGCLMNLNLDWFMLKEVADDNYRVASWCTGLNFYSFDGATWDFARSIPNMLIFFPFKASFGLNVLWTLLVSQTWYRKIYENSLFFLSFLLRDNFINWMIFFNAIKQRHWWRRVVYCLSKSGWDCETYIVMVLALVYYDKGCLKEKKNPS